MRLRDYLSFARRERNGIITLILLILLTALLPRFFPQGEARYAHPEAEPGQERLVSVGKVMSPEDPDRKKGRITYSRTEYGDRNRGGASYTHFKGKSFSAGPGSPAENISGGEGRPDLPLFEFDPNTLSAGQWKKLGLGERVITTIQRYTTKGGKFYQPEDIGKIYGLSKADYERLLPYVAIRKPGSAAQKVNEARLPAVSPKLDIYRVSGQDSGKASPRHRQATEKEGGITRMNNREIKGREEGRLKNTGWAAGDTIDINTADTGVLQRLPGIGGVLAARIVLFRKKLGGFSNLSQLNEVYGLTEEVYRQIAGRLTCDPGLIKKVNINAEELYPLRSHPYTKGYIAQTIINYRNQHGLFDSIAELKKINNITPETMEKMLPYLSLR